MTIFTEITIGFCLAMDAFSVSIAGGSTLKTKPVLAAFVIAFAFGFAQVAMPLIGWIFGEGIHQYLVPVQRWIPLVIFGFLGGKMIVDTFTQNPENVVDLSKFKFLFAAAIATSIDALGAGVSFAALSVKPFRPALIIGIVTFIMALIGVYAGNRLGSTLGKWGGFIGGIILIFIALKAFFEPCPFGIRI